MPFTAPTVSELQGQTTTYGSPSVSVKAKGTIAVADATQSYEVTIDDTTAETGVTFADGEVLSVFIVAEDDAANAQSAVTDLEITLADDEPPASASGYPKATSVATCSMPAALAICERLFMTTVPLPQTAKQIA